MARSLPFLRRVIEVKVLSCTELQMPHEFEPWYVKLVRHIFAYDPPPKTAHLGPTLGCDQRRVAGCDCDARSSGIREYLYRRPAIHRGCFLCDGSCVRGRPSRWSFPHLRNPHAFDVGYDVRRGVRPPIRLDLANHERLKPMGLNERGPQWKLSGNDQSIWRNSAGA